jgi:hypothetical protein
MRFLRRFDDWLCKHIWRMQKHPAVELLTVLNVTRDKIIADQVLRANTSRLRRKGLLDHRSLQPGEGLWILPCESVHTIGMKFAIDILYLDRKRRVRKVLCHVPAWRISCCLSAYSVLEVAAGTIAATGTERGDILRIEPVALPQAS